MIKRCENALAATPLSKRERERVRLEGGLPEVGSVLLRLWVLSFSP